VRTLAGGSISNMLQKFIKINFASFIMWGNKQVEPLVVARGILWFLGIEFRYHCNRTVGLQFIKKNPTKSCWIFLYEW